MRAEAMCSVAHANANLATEGDTTRLIVITGLIGIAFSIVLLRAVARVKIDVGTDREMTSLVEKGSKSDEQAWNTNERLHELYEAIRIGAASFISAEYKMCLIFVTLGAPLVGVLIARGTSAGGSVGPTQSGIFSAVSFTVGALTSMASGYIGMRVAVFSNA